MAAEGGEAWRVLRPGGRLVVLEASNRYLLHGIREFPPAEALAAEIGAHGFERVTIERQSLGIVAIHLARKPLHA